MNCLEAAGSLEPRGHNSHWTPWLHLFVSVSFYRVYYLVDMIDGDLLVISLFKFIFLVSSLLLLRLSCHYPCITFSLSYLLHPAFVLSANMLCYAMLAIPLTRFR